MKQLSKDHDSLLLQSSLLERLTAQIAIYSGKPVGGLAALQDLITTMENDGNTRCDRCGETGYRGRTPIHKPDCEIVAHYESVFGAASLSDKEETKND